MVPLPFVQGISGLSGRRSSFSFLFTIVAEWLNAFLFKAKDRGLIGGFEVDRGEEAIAYLQFANNTIIFSSSRWEDVVVLKRILTCFELVFGLKINLAKSMLVGVGCQREPVQELACKLKSKVDKLPFLYLGLLVRIKSKSKAMRDLVMENFG